MAYKSASVARTLCEKAGWTLTNLQLQKILYLAQMVYMGKHGGRRLIDDSFEAWEYGPVLPSVYHKVKIFGGNPVRDIFFGEEPITDNDDATFIESAARELGSVSPGKLVAITHSDEGAWVKHYHPNRRNVRIPDADIYDEYKVRFSK